MKTIFSHSPKDTRALARKLSKKLRGNEIILLSGELGVGKTEFVKGLAVALNIKEKITSPTFILQRNYQFRKSGKTFGLYHFDFYRLKRTRDLKTLGLEELVNEKKRIILIY